MSKAWPLYAVNNSFKSNWKLSRGQIRWVIKKGFAPAIALANAERIAEINASGVNIQDIAGLKKGIKVFRFDPDVDATNQLEREYSAPIRGERDW